MNRVLAQFGWFLLLAYMVWIYYYILSWNHKSLFLLLRKVSHSVQDQSGCAYNTQNFRANNSLVAPLSQLVLISVAQCHLFCLSIPPRPKFWLQDLRHSVYSHKSHFLFSIAGQLWTWIRESDKCMWLYVGIRERHMQGDKEDRKQTIWLIYVYPFFFAEK